MSKRAEQKAAPGCILTIHIAAVVLLLIYHVVNYSGGPLGIFLITLCARLPTQLSRTGAYRQP